MKKVFTPKYRVFTNNKDLVKVGCSYAGKMYYGIARCCPEDTFDYELGYRLAKARCDMLICKAKLAWSHQKIDAFREYADIYNSMLLDEVECERKLYQEWRKAFEELSEVEAVV